jgi:hypothetical protein
VIGVFGTPSGFIVIMYAARQQRSPINRAGFVLALFSLTLTLSLLPARAGGAVSGCTEASLRAAISGGGGVTFSSDCSITISQPIIINQADTTIDASGFNVTISGANAVPLFEVVTNLTLRGVSLINGSSTNSGGALYIQPGVVVIADQCVFAGNSATGISGLTGPYGATNSVNTGGNGGSGTQAASGTGGAIYNLGTLMLGNCTLTNNSATGGTGGNGGNGGAGGGTFAVGGNGGDGASGGAGLGGAVYSLGELTLSNCTFSANSAVGGNGGSGGAAGAGSYPGRPGNSGAGANGLGGAVYSGGHLTVIASTFSTNSTRGGGASTAGMEGNGSGKDGLKGALASGGAIYNASSAAITNCTFYTNSVVGGTGGNGGTGGGTFGVPGDGGDGGDGVGGALDNAGTVTIVNCTFSSSGAFGGTNGVAGSGNFTGANGNSGAFRGGNIANSGGTMVLMNSILAASASGANASGPFTDGRYNLSSDASEYLGALSFQNLDPELGPLTDNGGPTLTMALLTNSPAIDRIPPAAAPLTDQRGVPRPSNGLSDIGAFEFGVTGTVSNVMLSISQTTNGLFQLNGTGTSGVTYFIQASPDLSSWQTVSTNTAPFVYVDPVTNLPARFYRVTR